MSSVKLNNNEAGAACALCGDYVSPRIGPETFLAGTWRLV